MNTVFQVDAVGLLRNWASCLLLGVYSSYFELISELHVTFKAGVKGIVGKIGNSMTGLC
jgi:hypothetical protein